MRTLLPLFFLSALANLQAPADDTAAYLVAARLTEVTGLHLTFSGHVVRADNGKSIEGATVILAPCSGCEGSIAQYPPHDPVTTTTADGSYRFTNIPWRGSWIHVAHTGFVPTLAGCGDCAGNAISVEIKLAPASTPKQMNDSALIAEYGDARRYLNFRIAKFSPDGNVLQFVTGGDFIANGSDHVIPEEGRKYDVRRGTVQPGSIIPAGESNTQTVGEYEIDMEPGCSGCGGSLVGRNVTTGIRFRIADGIDNGYSGSSDGKVIFWSESNTMTVFELKGRRIERIILPYSPPFGIQPLAARPEGDGYLLAYDVGGFDAAGSCNPDGAAFIRQVESDQAEQVAQKDPNARARKPHNICFLHISMPAH